jgi:very-short-patch-repair endonuclease
MPVMSIGRTLCDLDGRVSAGGLRRLVDEVLLRRVVTLAELHAVYEDLRGGRRTIRTIGRVLAQRGAECEQAESRGEARLVRWLREAGLPAPVQQHEVGGYRVDLAYPGAGLFIEYDGFDPHTTRTRFDADRRRDNVLQLATGATVLRYTSASTREQVVREVAAALAQERAG